MSRRESTLSIRRFVELLELLDQQRRPLTSTAITAALQTPRSSMASLLRDLVNLGVLSLDRRSTTYLPTVRFAELTEWVRSSWLPHPRVLENLRAIRAGTDETISIWTAADLHMEVLHVMDGVHPLSLRLRVGQRFAIPFTAVGIAYLASLPSRPRGTLIRRLQAPMLAAGQRLNVTTLRSAVRKAARRRHACVLGGVIPEVGAVAVPLPPGSGPRSLIVSIGGVGTRIREQELMLARLLGRFAGS